MYIGIDIGYGHVKVVSDGVRRKMPALVGNYIEKLDIGFGRDMGLETAVVGGEKYLVGESAKHSPNQYTSRDPNWINSPAYRALNVNVMSRFIGTVIATITTGLPVGYYRRDKAKVATILTEVVDSLNLSAKVNVLPQPAGAFFAELLDEHGHINKENLASEKVGVLDIGYYTSDFLTFDRLQISQDKLASTPNGISKALETIKRDLEEKFQLEDTPLTVVEEATRTRVIRTFGKVQDISGIVDKRLKELADEILMQAKTLWGTGIHLDRVLLAGGGAAMLSEYLTRYSVHSTVVRNPDFAIAEGFYRFSKRTRQ